MRKIVVIVFALLTLALVVPASASQAVGSHRLADRVADGLRQRLGPQAVQAPDDAFTINDGFYTQTYNHFANPALGSVIAETWGETGWRLNPDDTVVSQNTQGVARAILLPHALRVSIRVELHGVTNLTDDVLATSGSANSSGKLTVQTATPEVAIEADPHCQFYTVVEVGIRWDDLRLSQVFLVMPIGFFNLNAATC